MSKITIISSTSRPHSNTLKVSRIYQEILRQKQVEVEILDLSTLPENFIINELHGRRSEGFTAVIQKYVSANHRFVFVVPEYNGSFPGVLKLFLDSVHPKEWTNKYACLVGISMGRAGNLRGMDHLAGILNYLKMHVYHNKLPISLVDKIVNADGHFTSEDQLKVSQAQLDGFLEWTKELKSF